MASKSDIVSVMRREDLRSFFEVSPTVRLLRSDLAPLVIDFLFQVFKVEESLSLGQAELRSRLAYYQEDLHEVEPDCMIGPPERYIANWVEAGWLKRFVEATSQEPQYQLTAHSEEAIRFVDAALARRQSMVGTESRLRLVIETLEDVVRGATSDPQQRMDFLKSQQAAIQQEMDDIESGKAVQVYRPAQIRERFQTAIQLLKGLQSDFRAVEERFQEIARDVQKLQSSGDDSRGRILGFALDAEDMLKQQDEGISFYAFAKFLLSPTQQNAVRKNIEEIQKLTALADQQDSLYRLRRMVPQLLAEADKVMRTTARLSATLRRLLDARAAAHRMRLAKVLQDIRKAALKLRDDPPSSFQFLLNTEPDIVSPLTRPFWSASASFDSHTMLEPTLDLEQTTRIAAAMARLHRLDFRKLRNTVRELTLEGDPIDLPDLLTKAPPLGGLVDVLGYMQIAHDDGHQVHPEQIDQIRVPGSRESNRIWTIEVPHITFIPTSLSRESGRKPR